MKIVILDGQGGGIGKALCLEIKKRNPNLSLLCLGTNALATAAMLKAGADLGATGENAIRVQTRDADFILGPIGIILKDALLGEITQNIAASVADSPAHKLLVPAGRCHVSIAGANELPISKAVEVAADELLARLEADKRH